jgi:hypothetical protein
MSQVIEDARQADAVALEEVARMYAAFDPMARLAASLEAEGRSEEAEAVRAGMVAAIKAHFALRNWGQSVKKVLSAALEAAENDRQRTADHITNSAINEIVEWDREEQAKEAAEAAERVKNARHAAQQNRRNLKQKVYIDAMPEIENKIRESGGAVTAEAVLSHLEDMEARLRAQGKEAPRVPGLTTIDGWIKKMSSENKISAR